MADVIVNGINYRCGACGRRWRGDVTHTCAEPGCPADAPMPEREIDFASGAAEEVADDYGLTLEDFEGRAPSGKTGLTVADVRELADELGLEAE